MKLIRMPFMPMLMQLALLPAANAQTVTGQISGTVADQGGSVIVGVPVTIVREVSREVREYPTDLSGNFLFMDLVPARFPFSRPEVLSLNQRRIH
jgi:hypothetical protein